MNEFQEKLDSITAKGSSGGGMVEIEFNGKMEVLDLRISPEAAEDLDMLQTLVMSAITDGLEKVREVVGNEMSAISGGLNLQGMPGFSGFPEAM
jgi:DNA-binding YbaB/EbfC family protein